MKNKNKKEKRNRREDTTPFSNGAERREKKLRGLKKEKEKEKRKQKRRYHAFGQWRAADVTPCGPQTVCRNAPSVPPVERKKKKKKKKMKSDCMP